MEMRQIINISESVKAFHGSVSDSKFIFGHKGNNSHTFGTYNSKRWGIFFSNNPNFAKIYGNVSEYILNIKNTFEFNEYNIDAFLESLDPFDPSERPIWQVARHIKKEWQFFEDDVGEYFVKYLFARDFDSATFIEYNEDENGVEQKSHTIVVFDPSLIKKQITELLSVKNIKIVGCMMSLVISLKLVEKYMVENIQQFYGIRVGIMFLKYFPMILMR